MIGLDDDGGDPANPAGKEEQQRAKERQTRGLQLKKTEVMHFDYVDYVRLLMTAFSKEILFLLMDEKMSV